jgi:hypothetical protein
MTISLSARIYPTDGTDCDQRNKETSTNPRQHALEMYEDFGASASNIAL